MTLQGAPLPIVTTGSPQFPDLDSVFRGKLGTGGCTKSPEPLPSAKDVDCDGSNIATWNAPPLVVTRVNAAPSG